METLKPSSTGRYLVRDVEDFVEVRKERRSIQTRYIVSLKYKTFHEGKRKKESRERANSRGNKGRVCNLRRRGCWRNAESSTEATSCKRAFPFYTSCGP